MSSPRTHPMQQPTNGPRRGNAVAVVALLIALASMALSAWAVFGPAPSAAEPPFTMTQQADARVAACAAADVVRRGVAMNTNLQSPGGDGDVTGSLAVAANARLSLFDGGQYLLARVEPATPTELASAVRQFGNTLMDIGAAATAGALNTDPEQATRLRDADSANAKVAELCA